MQRAHFTGEGGDLDGEGDWAEGGEFAGDFARFMGREDAMPIIVKYF